MSIVEGVKILNEKEQEEIRKQLIDDKEKEYKNYNGKDNISMEDIIKEIKCYRMSLR